MQHTHILYLLLHALVSIQAGNLKIEQNYLAAAPATTMAAV